MEILCFIESIVHIAIKFRTAVILRGPTYSYKSKDIWKAYWNSGFIFDIFGLSPFNLIFSALNINHPFIIMIPLKFLRIMIIFNVFKVIGCIQEFNYHISSIIYVCATFCGFIFLLHITSSAWY